MASINENRRERFKSAYLQNIMMQYSQRSGLYSLFFSLEMPDEKIFEREMQIANGISGGEVEEAVINVTRRTVEMSAKAKSAGSSKVLSVERPRLTLDHIAEYVNLAKARYELGVVAIDYLGLMRGDTRSSSADLTEGLSNGAKELAKECRLPVILLTQINRAAAKAQTDEGQEIELHHLKYGGEAGAAGQFGSEPGGFARDLHRMKFPANAYEWPRITSGFCGISRGEPASRRPGAP